MSPAIGTGFIDILFLIIEEERKEETYVVYYVRNA